VPTGETVACGNLTVPERHDKPSGPSIRLHVAVFKSHSATPAADPVVYLDGGPGGSSLKPLPAGFAELDAPFLADRDLILFDQRGVGVSEPALDCPEVAQATKDQIQGPVSASQSVGLFVSAYATCRDRLVSQGVDLDAYNSKEGAADLEQLRQALGYQQWNVYGVSYGTRLGLTYMRDYPSGIRSVVLDSTVPLQADLPAGLVPNARRALDVLFNGCRADPSCGSAYPNLESALSHVVTRLDATPASAQVPEAQSGQPTFEAAITGDEVLSAVFLGLYSNSIIPDLPRAIALADRGDLQVIAALLGIPLAEEQIISEGMYISVLCHEVASFSSPAAEVAAAQPYPELHDFVAGDSTFDVCKTWGMQRADPTDHQPVKSDIPTLILAGQYDPITPPADGQQVAGDLSHSFFFLYPGLGHGEFSSDSCPQDMTLTFLRAPNVKPDDSCIASMRPPAFVVH
jgi:pimeloyl-ACP methyl ester carboxylesterase